MLKHSNLPNQALKMLTTNTLNKCQCLPKSGVTVTVRNSSAGAFVRLSDPAIKPGVDKLKKQLSKDPEAARQFLEQVGYLTPKGQVSARYA